MRTRMVVALGLVCLVALAGCSALDSGESVEYPAGVTDDGIANASLVLQNHHDVIAADSYRIAYNVTYGSDRGTGSSTWVVASNASASKQVIDATIRGQEVDQYLNGDRLYARLTSDNQTEYNTEPLSGSIDGLHREEASPSNLLRTVVSSGNFSLNETETVDGREVITYWTNDARANASGQIPEQIQTYNATLEIDEDGRIWRAELFATGTTNGTQEIYYQEYRTLGVDNVTVSRPGWVDDVPE